MNRKFDTSPKVPSLLWFSRYQRLKDTGPYAGWGGAGRQHFVQYFRFSQSRAGFFRATIGRLQTTHSLFGDKSCDGPQSSDHQGTG
jgi:hypothetical protein